MSETGVTGEWWLHVHHGWPPLERLRESAATRRAYIRAATPPAEVETRLRLLRRVDDQAAAAAAWETYEAAGKAAWGAYQAAVQAAWEAYDAAARAARAAYDAAVQADRSAAAAARETYEAAAAAAWETDQAAVQAYRSAVAPAREALERLHAEQCVPDCPWDGETIFPK